MKTISILVPTYNEEDNIPLVYHRVVAVMEDKLPQYLFEVVFVDNASTDPSKGLIQEVCAKKKKSKKRFLTQKNF